MILGCEFFVKFAGTEDGWIHLPAQSPFDIRCGAIATAVPNGLGWKSEDETSLMEIGILRHNNEVVMAGKFPNDGVIRVPQTHKPEKNLGRHSQVFLASAATGFD